VRLFPAGSRRLAFLIATLVASAAAAIAVHASDGGPEHALAGETAQGHGLRLELDGDARAIAFATTVKSRCRGGTSWTLDWTPRQGDAVFRQRGDHLVVREVVERLERDGRISRIGAVMTAQVDLERADGEIRIVSRIHRGGREVQACDSGPVQWAAGIDARQRLADALPPRRPTGWYYPKVPSLAGKVSTARARFIQRTDRTCARTQRIRLARAILRFARARDGDRVHSIRHRIVRLKMDGNALGQRFGLQICTSNGPGRTPVPH
jgi:hypothetical protein